MESPPSNGNSEVELLDVISTGAVCRQVVTSSASRDVEARVAVNYDVTMTSLAASMPTSMFRCLAENRLVKINYIYLSV